ncbi:MAG: type II secretion system protein [Peptoniphilaceae bacterium]|nr:type II secretion system protein [Peptoniphilaceae bacterium]
MKKKAFTLIELIVVMGIISLLMSIVAIKFDLVRKVKEKNEIETIQANLNYCKEKARITGYDYGVLFEKPKSYFIVEYDSGIFIKKKIDLEVLEITNVKTNNNKNDKQVITFKPSGSVAYPGTVSFSSEDLSYSLSVGVAGANVQVKKNQ